MPVFDKSGSSQQYGSAGGSVTTTNEFATEVLNDTMRESGATTISWFKVNSAITKVNLAYNNIEDTGVKALAEAFKVNSTIKEVDLVGNKIRIQEQKH